MDFFESTKAVFQRIEKLEPQNVSKIIGHLLLKDQPELEMIRLAFCPDQAIQILVEKVKLELDLSPKPTISPSFSNLPTTMFTLFTPPLPQNGLWVPQFGPSNFDTPYYYQMLDFRPLDMPPRLPEMQVCNSFRQGYCKYGGSCRFLHVFQMQSGDCMVLNPPPSDEVMSSASLKQLELELVELLRCTRGIPISVSSLPILYFDRYRKVLQVEGYEMEIHRQGRFSIRMIKLIARMTTTSIRLTNKPHRRQSIILEEDVHRYVRFRSENGYQLQVYLTFPPESTFSEEDVLNYFNNFGPVQKVRIPSQVQRMFGFVAFVYPETAALVLTKTKPHYICGSQVLVKPFRKNEDKVHDQFNHHQDFLDAESMFIPRLGDLLGKRQTEDHEHAVELEASDAEGVPADYFIS